MYIGLHVKYPLFSSDLKKKASIFSTAFRKNAQISNFMKIRPMGAELFHVDTRTGMTKLILAINQLNAQNLLL